MYILAVDTSTNYLNISVSRGNKIVKESSIDKKSSHSKHILSELNNILKISNLSMKDVNLFAVSKGPGSFTGLRIGLSALKGLSYALDIPLVTVSSLEILAKQASFTTDFICPVIDARKNEVYYSIYSRDDINNNKIKSEFVGDVGEILKKIKGTATFIGTGANVYHEILSQKHTISEEFNIKASKLASIALLKHSENKINELIHSTPEYIRKSDAELNLIK